MEVAFYLFELCLTHVVADRVGWVEAMVLPVPVLQESCAHPCTPQFQSKQLIHPALLPSVLCRSSGLRFARFLLS